jgi:hypothetical protein
MTDRDAIYSYRRYKLERLVEKAGELASLAKFLDNDLDAVAMYPVVATSPSMDGWNPRDEMIQEDATMHVTEMNMRALAQACQSMAAQIERMVIDRVQHERGLIDARDWRPTPLVEHAIRRRLGLED